MLRPLLGSGMIRLEGFCERLLIEKWRQLIVGEKNVRGLVTTST